MAVALLPGGAPIRAGGIRSSATPLPRPPPRTQGRFGRSACMRFLCDEMLRGLGRWLRAAGHDTAIAGEGSNDRDLLARAGRDGRVLLTRDRRLAAAARPAAAVFLLEAQDVPTQARALRDQLGVDWLEAPFTRCMMDNAVLAPAGPSDVERMPASAQGAGGSLRACPACGRVYWPGSHVGRMTERLSRWQAGA